MEVGVVGVVWGAFLGGMDELHAQGAVERACLGVLAPQAAGAGKEEKRRREGGRRKGEGRRRGRRDREKET